MNLKEQLDTLLDATAFDSTGAKVGAVRQVYVDDASGKLTFATVSTGLFSADAIVPLHGARLLDDELHVDHLRAVIRDSPRPDNTEDALTPAQEVKLLEYYGIEPPAEGRGPVAPKSDAGSRAPKGSETVSEEKSAKDAPAPAKTAGTKTAGAETNSTKADTATPGGAKPETAKSDTAQADTAESDTGTSTPTPKKPEAPASAKTAPGDAAGKAAGSGTGASGGAGADEKKTAEQVVTKDEKKTTTTTTSPSAPTRTPASTPGPSTSAPGKRPHTAAPKAPATSENSGKQGSQKDD